MIKNKNNKNSTLAMFLKGFRKGTHNFGITISVIVNSILLAIVYFVGVGMTSIIAKLAKKHFLSVSIKHTKQSENEKTYWEELDLKKRKLEDYYRQF